MKSTLSLIGIVLIVLGIALLGYSGFSYTQSNKIAQVGNVQITADTQKTVTFPPYTGGLVLVGGIVLVALGRMK